MKGTTKQERDAMSTLYGAFSRVMESNEGAFATRETRALGIANELVRAWLEAELRRVATTFLDEVRVDGVTYRRDHRGCV